MATTGRTARQQFDEELEQLRLQVELMAVRVDENLERMRTVLRTGDELLAASSFTADDDIDAMNVSLTERCYLLLGREAPVASDLRFIVSVVRIISELERVGDLALRVVKLWPEQPVLRETGVVCDILLTLADEAVELYRTAFFTTEVNPDSDTRTGLLVEVDSTDRMFSNPSDERTENYVTGRFG